MELVHRGTTDVPDVMQDNPGMGRWGVCVCCGLFMYLFLFLRGGGGKVKGGVYLCVRVSVCVVNS